MHHVEVTYVKAVHLAYQDVTVELTTIVISFYAKKKLNVTSINS